MPTVRVHEVSSVRDLARHADAWDALALVAPERLPMLSYAWVASCLEHQLSAGQPWRCLFAYEGDDLVGVLPVVHVRRRLPGGVRLAGPVDAHTRSGHALLAGDRAGRALSAMLEALNGVEPRYRWLRFHGVRGGSPALVRGGVAGARTATIPAGKGAGSVLSVRGSYADFETGLPANFRRNLRKARNRCQRNHDASYAFHTAKPAGGPDLLQRFLDLEAAGWKGEAGTAIKCTPHLVDFYSALTCRLADRGWLEWHFLDLDGTPAAGHLAVRFGGSLVLTKIGYDPAYARLGPGNLLFQRTVARAFDDEGVDEVNCLTDMPWHDNWRMSQAHYSDVVITPRRLLPALAGLVEVRLPAELGRRARDTPWLAAAVRKAKAVRRVRRPTRPTT